MARKKKDIEELRASRKDGQSTVERGGVEEPSDNARMASEKTIRNALNGPARQHFEGLGAAWTAVTGMPGRAVIPQVVATVLKEGGTRPSWQWKDGKKDYVLLAWPKDEPLRAALLLAGEEGKQLIPTSCVPFLEGLANDLTVETVHPWEQGGGANVGVRMLREGEPMWFYDPCYVRDRGDLTEGVTHTFLLSALAFGVRKALLDEITVTSGPAYETYAQAWLEEHPGSTRLDVPELKINVAGKKIIHPGHTFAEYQIRTVIDDVEDCVLEKMPVKILYTSFPLEDRDPLRIPIYVASLNLGTYEPKAGDEIDAYVWFQGRVIDWDGEAIDTRKALEDEPGEQNS
ncbi:MAG: hypothetical protein K5657_03375 [Desulfovibrio sp.]|nr:hypothetical protein [Desulfovibrio sp.]